MITEDERFIEIQAILAFSDVHPVDCTKINDLIIELSKENESLKQKLNWIAFGDDPELSLRYLRKIGYVDFDEERKVYINKHNNEPFLLNDEQEKSYYIKNEELNEYTQQLEYQIKELKNQLEDCHCNRKERNK